MLSAMLPPQVVLASDPTVPVVTGMIAVFVFCGLLIIARHRKRWADFKRSVEGHGFTVVERPARFVKNWRTLATGPDGRWVVKIQEEEVPNSESADFFQELTLPLEKPDGWSFLIRPEGVWRKRQSVGETARVFTGEPDFDRAWCLETNDPMRLRAALTLELRTHLIKLRGAAGIVSLALQDGVIKIRDENRLLPAERFEHALHFLQALAALADGHEAAGPTSGNRL